jgi:glyoxylase-like metal-dependent hydrolase (beta-lactamase superfamily II)
MAADSCYLRRTLEEMILPEIVAQPEAMIASLKTLKKLQDGGARIFYGHDPDFWNEVPQAPLEIT